LLIFLWIPASAGMTTFYESSIFVYIKKESLANITI